MYTSFGNTSWSLWIGQALCTKDCPDNHVARPPGSNTSMWTLYFNLYFLIWCNSLLNGFKIQTANKDVSNGSYSTIAVIKGFNTYICVLKLGISPLNGQNSTIGINISTIGIKISTIGIKMSTIKV